MFKNSTDKVTPSQLKKLLKYKKQAAYLSRLGVFKSRNKINFTAKEKRTITKLMKHWRSAVNLTPHKVTKQIAKKYADAGYFTVKNTVYLDKMRDSLRRPIKGVKTSLNKNGVLTEKIRDRRQDLYIFTEIEKAAFLGDPEAYVKNLIQKHWRIYKGRKYYIRLHFSTFTGSQDYKIEALFNYVFGTHGSSPLKEGAKNNLAGIKIVSFSKPRSKKHAKKKASSRRR